MRLLCLILLIALFLTPTVFADEIGTDLPEERMGIPPIPGGDIPEISEEELLDIVSRADNFFLDQGIENLAVDIILYRDPAKKITVENMKNGTVEDVITLSPIYAHYFWQSPGWYEMRIMGMTVVSTEPTAGQTFTSLMPLPGGQILIPEITDNYDLTYLGKGEVNDRETHRVRLSAKKYKELFIKYSIFDFDVEHGYMARIETRFDDGWYKGSGSGEFYYAERDGKLLPAYGGGAIFIAPVFHINLWGTWFLWDFNSEDFEELRHRGDDDPVEMLDVDATIEEGSE